MLNDNVYAKYKFASDASGGQRIPGFERGGKFITHTAKLSPADNSSPVANITICGTSSYVKIIPNTVSMGNLNQGFFTISEGLPFSEQTPVAAINVHSLNSFGVISKLTGTTINSVLSIRKATPIFKETTVEKFDNLMEEWRSTRNPIDSGIEMFTNAAYQKIIGMGHEVVPLILKELEVNVDYWFWALKAITGKDPVPPAHRGRLKLMARDWLSWAKKQGYQW